MHKTCLRSSIALTALCLTLGSFATDPATAATIWNGPTLSFSKTSSADPTLPANQDRLTNNVIITRGASQGIYNIAAEDGYDRSTFASPAGTTWATAVNNPSADISAANWAALNFTNWAEAYGGPGSALASNITSTNAVVHLTSADVYLNLTFTQFSSSSFSYQRSTPVPEPTSLALTLLALSMFALRQWRPKHAS